MKKLFTVVLLLGLISLKAQTWEKVYSTTYTMGGLGCQENEFNSTSGGLYLGMTNWTPPLARIIRFDSLGDTLWTKPVTLDSIGCYYYVTSTAQKLNGNYLLGGFATTTASIAKAYFIIELTSGGNHVKRDQFVVNTNQYGIDLEAAKSNNDYYIAYKADSIIGSNAMRFNTLIKRVTPSGAIAWQQSYVAYGTFSSFNGAWVGGIHSTLDDGLVYFKGEAGITSFEKRDQAGVLTWTVDIKNMLGVSLTNSINIDSHSTLKDSGFVFSCQVYNPSKFWSYLVKLDKNGNLVDTVKYDQTGLMSLAEASDGKILACYMSFISSKIHSGLLTIDKTLGVNNFYPSPFTYNTNNFGKICPNNSGGGMVSISLQPGVIGGPGYAYLVNFDSLINTYPFTYKGSWTIDKNKDCNLGSGDKTYPYQLIKIKEASSPGDKYCLTNNLGEYSTSLPNGNYTVTHSPFNYRNYECPSTGGYTFNVTGAGLSTGNNLYDTLVPGIKEVSNVIFSNEFVPGFNSYVQIFYSNKGSTLINSQIKILKDTSLIYITSVPPVSTISGDTLIYNIPNFDVDSTGFIGLIVRTRTVIPLGTKIRLTSNFPLLGDTVPTNNLDTLNSIVVGSFDPNDKSVSEPMCMNLNNDLFYKVRFQNTGTGPAKNILIVDTLDANLNLMSYKLVYKSHPNLDIKWRSNNRMEYRFDNINLPDSNSNEPLSHGEIVYSIKANSTIPLNTKIRNRGWIYFDYNLPVITNVTENMVCSTVTSLSQYDNKNSVLTIFPNPASSKVNIRFDGYVKRVELYDLTGHLIQSNLINREISDYSLEVPVLHEGLYFIKLYTDNQIFTNKLVIMH